MNKKQRKEVWIKLYSEKHVNIFYNRNLAPFAVQVVFDCELQVKKKKKEKKKKRKD